MNEGIGNVRFVASVNNDDDPASLEGRKIYHTIEDKEAESHGFLRTGFLNTTFPGRFSWSIKEARCFS